MHFADVLSGVMGVGVLLGGVGYAIGQFLSAKRKGHADALTAALNEVVAYRGRAERLEIEVTKAAADLLACRAEAVMLRSLLGGGPPVIEAIDRARDELVRIAHDEHDRTRKYLAEIMEREGGTR